MYHKSTMFIGHNNPGFAHKIDGLFHNDTGIRHNDPSVYGPDAVFNGNFSQGDLGWFFDPEWSVVSGEAVNDGTQGDFSFIVQTLAGVIPGDFVALAMTVKDVSGLVIVQMGSDGDAGALEQGNGVVILQFGSDTDLIIAADVGATAVIDEISVRPLVME